MKKALVTGANGFIGSWLLRELIKNGVTVLAVVKSKKSQLTTIANLPNVRIIYADMSNIIKLVQQIPDRDIDVFYHLAWTGSTGQQRADYELQLLNAKYTIDAVNAAASLGCSRFVGAGTLAEIDCNAYATKENSRPLPVSCYGTAKIASHFMSKAECNRLGIEHIWAYFSNTYGEGNHTQNFVNFASSLMLDGKRAAFTSGEQLYDFVHVSDNAQALYLLGEKGQPFNGYYIGSTKPKPLKHFICRIRDEIDSSIPLYLGEVNFDGVMQPASAFDCAQLIEDTGYQPKVAFEEGIKRTIAWLREERGNNGSKIFV